MPGLMGAMLGAPSGKHFAGPRESNAHPHLRGCCPVRWTTGRWSRAGESDPADYKRFCRPPPTPVRCATWRFRPESNRVSSLRRAASKIRYRKPGKRAPGWIRTTVPEGPDLQSGAINHSATDAGVNARFRSGDSRVTAWRVPITPHSPYAARESNPDHRFVGPSLFR